MVRGWVRDKDDPEPTLNSLKKRVMPEGRYGNAAQWFLGSVQFLDWCETFQNPESQETRPESPDRSSTSGTPPMNAQPSVTEQPPTVITSTTDDSPAATTQVHRPPDPGSANDAEDVQNTARRVLWLRGGYKTGKTTAMYHTYVALESSADFQLVDKKLRVVPYFCDASSTDQTNQTRPKYETIIRGLLWHMSLSPDFILAEPVQDLYNVYHSTRASKKEPEIEDWETLFKNLVSDQQYHYSFLVDALDECISPKEVGGFLKFMSIVLKSHPNTSLLCSSHAQVNVSRFFGADNRYFGQDTLEVVDVTAEESADDMRYFIQHELERRKVEAKRSIFYNPQQQGLLTDLEDALMRHAQGNFRWVQIWLDILLPNDDDDDMQTIRSEEVAKTRLRQLEYDASYEHDDYQQLEAGYRRLWDLNRLTDADELGLRTRLFHIILASRWAQTPETLSATLRIRESSYSDFPLPEDVERMSSNFLIRTQTWSGAHRIGIPPLLATCRF
ncbi:hypothetical protein BDV96DRAFT_189735 [Lophiotrema nucula]|uniref:Nephrocystin 3-like N-terminal domain-containing protein n=1 Tax=Lophiotrema nucula TaxID=690887 RepID=A0A6A5YXF3_9PLEO|nr:hypothetical protein BDV96DRAFT_189735 [Lophiotrema nucula]